MSGTLERTASAGGFRLGASPIMATAPINQADPGPSSSDKVEPSDENGPDEDREASDRVPCQGQGTLVVFSSAAV